MYPSFYFLWKYLPAQTLLMMCQSVQMTEMNVQTRSKSESVFILTFQGLENKEIFAAWYQGKIIEIWHQE